MIQHVFADQIADVGHWDAQPIRVDPLWVLDGDNEHGKSWRHDEITQAYRKIGLAVEHRISERGLTVTPEKRWDAIDFLFAEFLNADALGGADHAPDTRRIDSVLALVA